VSGDRSSVIGPPDTDARDETGFDGLDRSRSVAHLAAHDVDASVAALFVEKGVYTFTRRAHHVVAHIASDDGRDRLIVVASFDQEASALTYKSTHARPKKRNDAIKKAWDASPIRVALLRYHFQRCRHDEQRVFELLFRRISGRPRNYGVHDVLGVLPFYP